MKFEIRRAFKRYEFEPTGELFDRADAYVAEHYSSLVFTQAGLA